jgi:hypothetical protein
MPLYQMESCLTVLPKSERDDVILLTLHNIFFGKSVARLTRALAISSISIGHITLALDSDHRKHFWPIPRRRFGFDKGTCECLRNHKWFCCCGQEEWLSKLPNTVASLYAAVESRPRAYVGHEKAIFQRRENMASNSRRRNKV